jgi:hypothetical protein
MPYTQWPDVAQQVASCTATLTVTELLRRIERERTRVTFAKSVILSIQRGDVAWHFVRLRSFMKCWVDCRKLSSSQFVSLGIGLRAATYSCAIEVKAGKELRL